jgi:hypothetical protein
MTTGLVLVYGIAVIVTHVIGAKSRVFWNHLDKGPGFPTCWHFCLLVVSMLVLGWKVLVIRGLGKQLEIPVFTPPKKKDKERGY